MIFFGTEAWKAALGVAAMIASDASPVAGAGGIPEPGLILYGTLTNASGQDPAPASVVSWSVLSGRGVFTKQATMLNVNGQAVYVLQVPFESRFLAGAAPLPATPNTLEEMGQP